MVWREVYASENKKLHNFSQQFNLWVSFRWVTSLSFWPLLFQTNIFIQPNLTDKLKAMQFTFQEIKKKQDKVEGFKTSKDNILHNWSLSWSHRHFVGPWYAWRVIISKNKSGLLKKACGKSCTFKVSRGFWVGDLVRFGGIRAFVQLLFSSGNEMQLVWIHLWYRRGLQQQQLLLLLLLLLLQQQQHSYNYSILWLLWL